MNAFGDSAMEMKNGHPDTPPTPTLNLQPQPPSHTPNQQARQNNNSTPVFCVRCAHPMPPVEFCPTCGFRQCAHCGE